MPTLNNRYYRDHSLYKYNIRTFNFYRNVIYVTDILQMNYHSCVYAALLTLLINKQGV